MTPEFLKRLRKIDKARFTARDVLILHHIANAAGCCGNDLRIALGCKDRSCTRLGIKRLLAAGFIVDHRPPVLVPMSPVPHAFHVTEEGRLFLKFLETD